MLSRRDLIGKVAVGAAAAVAVGAVRTGVEAATRPLRDSTDEPAGTDGKQDGQDRGSDGQNAPLADTAMSAPPPWELVAPFRAGAVMAHGWRLTDLSPVQHGAAVLTLANARGRAQRIHLCRNDGSPQGVVYTRRVDFVVMNEGYGDLPTEEHLGQAVAALAQAVAANEATVADGVFAALLPHTERVRQFAAADATAADAQLR
jgi:hypothetical protein